MDESVTHSRRSAPPVDRKHSIGVADTVEQCVFVSEPGEVFVVVYEAQSLVCMVCVHHEADQFPGVGSVGVFKNSGDARACGFCDRSGCLQPE